MVKRFDEPKEKITPEYLEIAKRGKIIEFIQFLGCLSPGLLRVCALYLVKNVKLRRDWLTIKTL